ncbi:Ig-like domain-containing protein [Oceanirhabdus seepicola]|uniref:BIG2 domain-containing protein n=1 Tax=Oceanirhabdus seepicola TaxID=2828781 RepID=A0A9J6P0Z7_9CLOT|nr:Ig-like domain-containing protein [Oceanirhabdus seepicola]MCM1990219.1 hypothetical protein [Oceanirhabdus seepicola]
MRRFRGITIFTLIMFLISNFSVFAEMPNNTVVIGDKAYDLNYVKREENYSEVLKTMQKSPEIFVKSESGQWYENNTTSKISNESIPKVTYKDVNGKLIDYDINDGEKIGEPLSITENNKKISGAKINGNVYITGDNVTIHNSTVNGIIYIDPGKEGSTDVKNVTAKEIVILSGGENSIHLYNVTADKLEVSSDSKVRVESKGTTKVNNTIIKTYAIIDSVSGSFGEIRVSVENDGKKGEQQNVELRGTFTEAVIVETGVTLKAAKDASVKQIQIAPKNKNDNIKLLGDFKKIEVNKEANIELVEGQVDKIITNVKTKLNISKESKVKQLDKKGNKVETSGDGKKNITKTDKDNSKSSSSNNSGNSSHGGDRDNDWNDRPTPVVKVSSVIIDKNGNEIIINQGGSKQFTARVRYTDNSTNNAMVWESSDTSIATVVNGLVTVASDKIGSAIIKASATRGGVTKSDQVVVTIKSNGNSGIIKTNNGVVTDNISEYILRVNGDPKGSQESPIEFYSDEYIVIEKDLIIEAGQDEFVKVRNIGVKGNIIIRGKDGNGGSITLDKVKVQKTADDEFGLNSGKIIVKEVATHSLHLENGVTAGQLQVTDGNGARIDVKDASIGEVNIASENGNEQIDLQVADKAKIDDLYVESTNFNIDNISSNNKKLADIINFVERGENVDLSQVKISNKETTLDDIRKEVNTADKIVAKLDELNNLYVSNSGEEEYNSWIENGKRMRRLIEDADGIKYDDGGEEKTFTLGNEYKNYEEWEKIRLANSIRSYRRDYFGGKFENMSELQYAFEKAVDQLPVFIECSKYDAWSGNTDGRTGVISNNIELGADITDIVLKTKDGETPSEDFKVTLGRTSTWIYDESSHERLEIDGRYIQCFEDKVYLMQKNVSSNDIVEDISVSIQQVNGRNGSNTNFHMEIEKNDVGNDIVVDYANIVLGTNKAVIEVKANNANKVDVIVKEINSDEIIFEQNDRVLTEGVTSFEVSQNILSDGGKYIIEVVAKDNEQELSSKYIKRFQAKLEKEYKLTKTAYSINNLNIKDKAEDINDYKYEECKIVNKEDDSDNYILDDKQCIGIVKVTDPKGNKVVNKIMISSSIGEGNKFKKLGIAIQNPEGSEEGKYNVELAVFDKNYQPIVELGSIYVDYSKDSTVSEFNSIVKNNSLDLTEYNKLSVEDKEKVITAFINSEEGRTQENLNKEINELNKELDELSPPSFEFYTASPGQNNAEINLKVTLNKEGKVYYIVVGEGQHEPEVTEVIAGTNYKNDKNEDVVVVANGKIDKIQANIKVDVTISGLPIDVDNYDIYIVAEGNNISPNIQSKVTSITGVGVKKVESGGDQTPADITALTIAVDNAGAITGDTATAEGTLKYVLISASKATEINGWNVETTDSDANSDLGGILSNTKPTISSEDNGQILVVVEIKEGKVVSAGESAAINIAADIADLTIVVDNTGIITSDTATAEGTLKYALVSASKATEINGWNIETTEANANLDLGGTLSDTKPVITNTDNTKILVVAEIKDGKVVAAGESVAINVSADIADLTIAVDNAGVITGDTATAEGTLKYVLISASKATEINGWNVETTDSDANSDLGGILSNTKPTISSEDNGQILVVVEIKEGKVVSAGESAAINIAADIADLTIVVDNTGIITSDTATAEGTLKYALVSASKATEINGWNIETTEANANLDLGGTLSDTKPVITNTDNTKILVVAEIKDGKVVAAGESVAINVSADIADLTIAVDNAGAITGDTATAEGTLKYVLISASKATEINGWNIETTDSDANSDLGGILSNTKPTISSEDNGQILVVVEIKDGKVVAAGESSAINVAAEE